MARVRYAATAVTFVLVLGVGIGTGVSSFAATLTVGVSPGCATIQACIDNAGTGDVVMIPAGSYNESITLTKQVSLAGAGSGVTTVTAGSGRVLTVLGAAVDSTVQISGLTLTGGDVSGGTTCVPAVLDFTNCGGGLLVADAARPELADLVIDANRGWVGGGMFIDEGSPIDATDVSLTNNVAILRGGGGVLDDGGAWLGGLVADNVAQVGVGGGLSVSGPDGLAPKPSLLIDGVRFERNESGTLASGLGATDGGGMYVFNTNLTVANGTFLDNECHVECDGGGLNVIASFVGTSLTLLDSRFEGNVAVENGAGVAAGSYLVSADVSGTEFVANVAGRSGGGLFAGSATIDDSTFVDNQALGVAGSSAFGPGEGGGALMTLGCGPITHSTFATNHALRGGALSCRAFVDMTISSTTFDQNVADIDGGAIVADLAGVALNGGSLTGNIAGAALAPSGSNAGNGFGGAVWSQGDVVAVDVDVTDNQAIAGGGIYVASGSLALSNGRLDGNVSTGTLLAPRATGGGAYVPVGDLVAVGTVISDNSAANAFGGGGAALGGILDLADVVAERNTAPSGGAFVARQATIDTSTLRDNEATAGFGGALQVFSGGGLSDGTATVTDSSFTGNSASAGGGALSTAAGGSITDSTFDSNSAGNGGAVASFGPMVIGSSSFVGNSATSGGGGGLLGLFDPVALTGVDFVGNSATQNGGGVSTAGNVEIVDTRFEANTAGGNGAGLSTSGSIVVDALTEFTGNGAGGDGGAMWVNSNLDLTGTLIQGNGAGGDGGGVWGGGVTATGLRVFDNIAAEAGGGVYARFDVDLADSKLLRNGASDGGGLLVARFGTVSTTLIADNSATSAGGGLHHLATGFAGSAALVIDRSTIAANGAPLGDGAFFDLARPVELTNSTVSDDTIAAVGASSLSLTHVTLHRPGGVVVDHGSVPVSWQGSLIVGSCTGAGVVTSVGGNIESDGDTCGLADPSDTVGAALGGLIDPILADNGGPTPTHTLPSTSPAVDGAGPNCPALDQRGASRIDGACDVGAVEIQALTGCSLGYWKAKQHHDSWVELAPTDHLADVFDRPIEGTLLSGLKAKGGGLNALLRQAVAAALNATHPDLQPGPAVDDLTEVVAAFQNAYDTGSYERQKDTFEATNTAGCPLS